MTGLAQAMFPSRAEGDFISVGERTVGARLIGQKFEGPRYFWSRPSAIDYNPLPSGGSNLGPTSESLKRAVEERRTKLKAAHPDQPGEPPQDLLFASGSGLDPHISPAAAEYQVSRVARARGLEARKIRELISGATQERSFGFLGEPVVNVLLLNLALDQSPEHEGASF